MTKISEAFKIHDKYQFELKFVYPLDRQSVRNDYYVDTFLFIPGNLGINKQTYPADSFYRDMRKYIRLKTPAVRLESIIGGVDSPFAKLRDAIEGLSNPDRENGEKFARCEERMKMFCSIMKSALRDEEKITEAKFRDPNAAGIVAAYLDNGVNALRQFRALGEILPGEEPGTDISARRLYAFVDEFLSLTVNKYRYALYEALRRSEWAAELERRIVGLLTEEIDYRKSQGYPSIPEIDGRNETIIYRENLLKKLMASVLFLKSDTRQDGVLMMNVVFGIGAGLAMTFAAAVTLLTKDIFFQEFSLGFFAVVVLAYVFKDRIKELSRTYLYSKVRSHLHIYDYKTIIRSSLGKAVGICRESFSFASAANLRGEIGHPRSGDPLTAQENLILGDSVIHARRHLKIHSKHCEAIYSDFRVDGLVDIVRFNVRHFLEHMDNPVRVLFMPDGKGSIRRIKGARVYHIHMLIRCSAGSFEHQESSSRFRITLARNGIKRIEKLD